MMAPLELDKNARILIVDDEPVNLKLLDRILTAEGYKNLVLVQDPQQAERRYREERTDLILLDIKMPVVDGFQLLDRFREMDDPLFPPIIVLTAQNDKSHLMQALMRGARDFIGKPFDRYELLMRVKNQIEAQMSHRLVHNRKAVLEDMVRHRTEELHRTRLQVVQRLGMAAEYRDEETGNHILRVSHSSKLLAEAIGWEDALCDLILNAAPMHDIGKIGIPDAILCKPGKLDPGEWEIMKTHAEIGGRLLNGDDSDLMRMARDIAMTHHEKWDGSGYPRGLAGKEIPMAGRIVALLDVFDALTSERPYKKAWPVDDAVELVRKNRGKHFDPMLVDVFLQRLPDILDVRARYAEPPADVGVRGMQALSRPNAIGTHNLFA
jgi:putative two-component system response regulator